MLIMKGYGLMIERDLKLACRSAFSGLTPLFFFVVVACFFPLAMTVDKAQLQQLGPGALWIAALLAILLSMPAIFHYDFEDGALQQAVLAPRSLVLFVYEKLLVHWCLVCVPLLLLLPLLNQCFHMPPPTPWVLTGSLLLGTPIMCCIGALGSALTMGVRNSGVLLALVVLPLYVPIVIFGTNSVSASMSGLPYSGQWALLGALLIGNLSVLPWVIAWVLRMGVSV